jgi:hypothetical protein
VLLFLRVCVQHLWTGPISNAPVEIIQGGRSVEVRPVGVTKGLAMQRILGYMAHIMGRQVRRCPLLLSPIELWGSVCIAVCIQCTVYRVPLLRQEYEAG